MRTYNFFSLWHGSKGARKQGSKEAKKQGSNLVDGNWKERMNLKSWNLGMKMHPVPTGLIYGNREKRIEAR